MDLSKEKSKNCLKIKKVLGMTHIGLSQSAKSYFRVRRYDPLPGYRYLGFELKVTVVYPDYPNIRFKFENGPYYQRWVCIMITDVCTCLQF